MKHFQDYSDLALLFYRTKSFFYQFTVSLKIRYKGLQKMMDTQSNINDELREQVKAKDLITSFYKFNSPQLLFDWQVQTDKEIGGESKGALFYNEKESCVTVIGKTINERNDLLRQRMYVALQCLCLLRTNLQDYNGIRLRIQTNGNLYKVVLTCNTNYENIHDCYAFIVDKTNQWQTLEIPFSRFLIEKLKGYENNKFMEHIIEDQQKFIIYGLSVILESEKEEECFFQLKDIEFIYKFEFNELIKYYQRPFFFQQPQNYQEINYINLGQIILEKKVEQQINYPSVNEYLNQKENQQFQSIDFFCFFNEKSSYIFH
ncbi:hypothetical protein IMG5_180760 [Ichthyophthirius multifiliis]|uniref:NADH:ubiquinone oxidoreductase intermediate-associated protein 30 domain-containing protein n=1 Tax=Ichthyophthirius multifiliis TaxID=5932 RepID=G0R2R4_ICHMU|nr:hypothetical protein IMG5_180760 [Ichthyophthirius multifiliis]EGR28236.1 hypothetical protein IMG5_180760 [Ichthyophthirius multifiliis]|eukprot:XP_004027581.1 hypothetical protein IMG5_180760 [Ichthyophthirius multifiliis]